MVEDARAHSEQVIQGDFNPAGGPLSFPGKLIVTGDIPDQSEIETNNGIEVHGVVGAAVLRTHGDIFIARGASGPGYIEASRDIRLRFVENSTLVCGGNLIVEVSAMHSRLSAGHKIVVAGEDGVLVGGVASAGISISAAKIGSRLYTPTTLQVGIPPLLRSEHNRLMHRINQIEQRRDVILKNAEYLERLSPDIASDKMKKRIAKLPLMRLHIKHLSDELNKYIRRYEGLHRAIDEQAQHGRVDSIKEIFPGVTMTIYWTIFELKEQLERATFFEREGEIVWEPLHSSE
jgi:hypothetical protein